MVNLGAYVGQAVTLQFRVETNGSLNSNLFIDDVSFTNATGTVNAPIPMRLPDAEQFVSPKQATVIGRDAPAVTPEARLWESMSVVPKEGDH